MLVPRALGITPEELEAQFSSYRQHTNALARAIVVAQGRGDTVTVANLRVQLEDYARRVQADALALRNTEMPNEVLMILADISTDLKTGLSKVVDLVPSLSAGILGVAAIAGVIYFWALRPKGRKA